MGYLQRVWQHIAHTDGWENAVTMLGTAYASLSHHRMVDNLWLTPEELTQLYVGDSIARRLVLEPLVAAFAKGFTLSPPSGLDTERAQADELAIRDKLEALGAVDALIEALAWGELYGRGGLLLGASDGSTDPRLPLAFDRVRELRWVAPLTAEEFSAVVLDDDRDSPTFGAPVLWQVRRSSTATPVETHASRIIITGSVLTSRRLQEENEWRDIPLLQSIYEDLRNYNHAKTSMAQMLVDASQAVLKILNLPAILSNDDTVLRARLRILEMARALHILPINAGDMTGAGAEDFQYVERTFGGVADTFDRLLGCLSSSAAWPQTKLFGRSPAGENATGEADQDNWDDHVLGKQTKDCVPPLQSLVDLTVTTLQLSEGWTVSFPPLRQMTPTEQTEQDKAIAETDAIYISAEVYDPLVVAQYRFGGDEVNRTPVMIPKEDLEAQRVLQEQNRERALAGPPESELAALAALAAGAPEDDPPQPPEDDPGDEEEEGE